MAYDCLSREFELPVPPIPGWRPLYAEQLERRKYQVIVSTSAFKCILTLHCLSQVVADSFLLNHLFVNLSRGYVIVPTQCDVQESLVVAQVQVNFTAIVKDVNLTCEERNLERGIETGKFSRVALD